MTAGALLTAADAQGQEIKESRHNDGKSGRGQRMLGDIVVTLENRPCIIKRIALDYKIIAAIGLGIIAGASPY